MSRSMLDTKMARLVVLLVLSLPWVSVDASGQQSGTGGTTNGEWRHYTGSLDGSRYSPLDQIDASNFNDLEVAWRLKTDNFGDRPEYKLEGTPLMIDGVLYTTAGTRRAVIAIDAKTGELLWTQRMDEGRRGQASVRQLSGRGVAYWTDGQGDERILYMTIGYRLVALDAETGREIPTFGDNGAVDLKVGVLYGRGTQIDLVEGQAAIHATPTIARDYVIVGATFDEGQAVPTHDNAKGIVRAYDVRTGALRWSFNTIPGPGEFGNDTWLNESWAVNGNVGVWTQITADEDLGSGLRAGRDADLGSVRGAPAGREPVRREHRLSRSGDRRTPLALPDRAPPGLEHGSAGRAAAGGSHRRRARSQGGGRADEAVDAVHLRPRDRRAGVSDRGAARAAGRHPGRVVLADATDPDQATGRTPATKSRFRTT